MAPELWDDFEEHRSAINRVYAGHGFDEATARAETPHASELYEDGLEILKEIKKTNPNIPVVMTTAVCDDEVEKQALEAGAADYITKPLDIEYLKNTLFAQLLN